MKPVFSQNNPINKSNTIYICNSKLKIEVINQGGILFIVNFIEIVEHYNFVIIPSKINTFIQDGTTHPINWIGTSIIKIRAIAKQNHRFSTQ